MNPDQARGYCVPARADGCICPSWGQYFACPLHGRKSSGELLRELEASGKPLTEGQRIALDAMREEA